MICLNILYFEKTFNLPYVLGRIKVQISTLHGVQGQIVEGLLFRNKKYFILTEDNAKWHIDGRLIRGIHELKYKKHFNRYKKKSIKRNTKQLKLF